MSAATPMGYFLHSAGPAAHATMVLGWVFGAICAAVCVIVFVLLAVAIARRRSPEETRGINRDNKGLRWVFIGAGISTVILFGMAVYALIALNRVAYPPGAPQLELTVTGYQWWWRVEYGDADPARRFVTANEIHIPVGVPVLINLRSADVIHSFWAPLLAGKTQMIPGLANRQWLQADAPGVYRGQCVQFCGVQHAHMAFEIVAQSRTDFDAWRDGQIKPAPLAASAGAKIFQRDCAACHAIRGAGDAGGYAPDLTHLQSRRMIAAGMLTNTPGHVAYWIAHTQDVKPGARMPAFRYSATDEAVLLAYLATLH